MLISLKLQHTMIDRVFSKFQCQYLKRCLADESFVGLPDKLQYQFSLVERPCRFIIVKLSIHAIANIHGVSTKVNLYVFDSSQ